MFRFAYPVVLLVLFSLLGIWIFFRFRTKTGSITYSMTSRLIRVAGASGRMADRAVFMLRILCLVLLILAAGRPQLYNVSHEVRSSGVDIVLCIDTSGSMRAMDFKLDRENVTRLDAVKHVVDGFIEKRPADRIGLVVFGSEAFTQSPLTMDKGLLLGLVDDMSIGMAGEETAIGSAIAIAGKRLKDLKAKTKLIILLTDGRSNAGDIIPVQAAGAVEAFGVKIYSIGVGGYGEAPFLVNTMFGPRTVYRRVDLDEETLKQVAAITGGRYFLASDTKELSEIYNAIDHMEKTEVKVKKFFHFKELYLYFLVPSLLLLGIELVLKATILGVLP